MAAQWYHSINVWAFTRVITTESPLATTSLSSAQTAVRGDAAH